MGYRSDSIAISRDMGPLSPLLKAERDPTPPPPIQSPTFCLLTLSFFQMKLFTREDLVQGFFEGFSPQGLDTPANSGVPSPDLPFLGAEVKAKEKH